MYYGYEEYTGIMPEQILQRVNQEKIFEFILKQEFSMCSRYRSPYRTDNSPGCRFEMRPDGTIVFVDFGERLYRPEKTHRSCLGMVQESYGVSMDNAIKIVCSEFGLSTNPSDYSLVTSIAPFTGYHSEEKIPTVIRYDKTLPDKFCINYLSQFLIKPEHIKEDNVFPTKRFYIKKRGDFKTINLYRPAFAIDFIDAVKIYQPYSTNYRWITNCNENHIGNIDNLPETGRELIIKKAYKDHRVLRNLNIGLNVIWFQNEGCVPSIEILENLVDRFKIITIFFDNDNAGVLAANKLKIVFNSIRSDSARIVFLPKLEKHFNLFGSYLKDPSAWINKEGRKDLVSTLNQMGIYGQSNNAIHHP